MTRLLVCGDREWSENDRTYMYNVLDRFHMKYGIDVLIEGEAPGADLMSKDWAISRGVPVDSYPAEWERYRPTHPGRKNPAGPIRNKRMLDEGKPEAVLAFHRNPAASKGSKHMVKIAHEAGIPYAWCPKGDSTLELLEENDARKEDDWTAGSIVA